MQNPLTWLSKKLFSYQPLITVEISRDHLIHNLEQFSRIAPRGCLAPVLKSNAYGHGIFEIAEILEEYKKTENSVSIPFFVVDSYFEAKALRARGVKTPLLIIGYTRPEIILSSRLKGISYTITSIQSLQEIENCKRKISIHLKIDTGMNRQGISLEETDFAFTIIKSNINIYLSGICSHLSDSDNDDSSFTDLQLSVWNNIVEKTYTQFPKIEYVHISATYGHRYSSSIKANVSRLGIGMYGLVDIPIKNLNLLPVLEMKTMVTGVKNIKKGETIGYNNTFKAEKDITIATIPVGYYEGLDRELSNKGYVKTITGELCPIIGNVSMNITIIDVTDVPNIKTGSKITVISNNPNDKNSIVSIAKLCQTIPYESVIRIPAHLKRVVV